MLTPCGGGGVRVRARGRHFMTKFLSSVAGLIEYLCLGVGTFDLLVVLLLWDVYVDHTCYLIMKSPFVF